MFPHLYLVYGVYRSTGVRRHTYIYMIRIRIVYSYIPGTSYIPAVHIKKKSATPEPERNILPGNDREREARRHGAIRPSPPGSHHALPYWHGVSVQSCISTALPPNVAPAWVCDVSRFDYSLNGQSHRQTRSCW